VARSRSRPASQRQRQNWSPPFSLANARAAYAGLSAALKSDWEDYAAAFVTWPIEGSPRYATGADSFANFYTVQLLLDPLATIPDAPLNGVTWQPRPKFFPFAEWESGFYTLKAETEFAMDTTILFSSVPPSKTVFNGEWYGEKIVGSEVFDLGLIPNEQYDGVHNMIESQFGSIDSTMKIWGRVWEVAADGGSIRVLKDPCTINPIVGPPPTGLTITIFNDYYDEAAYTFVGAYDDAYEEIGTVYIEDIAGFEEASGDIEFLEGYDASDIASLEFTTIWLDMSVGWADAAYDDSNPFEFTVQPDF